MQKDSRVDMTIKMAFEQVVNTNMRTAKALVFYLDEMFKKEMRTLQTDELSDRIDRVIQIFRYLKDKDIFEGFYVNSFAKRLLESRQIQESAETALVVKLKEECGFQFTQRLEVMFKDMKMSEDLCNEFREQPAADALDVNFNVKVLTSGHWPNYLKENNVSISLPMQIQDSMASFAQFYYSKYNNGRMLNWKLNLGSAELKAGLFVDKKNYEFMTSTY
jgi:cullin 3